MYLQFHCLAHALAQETIRNVFFRKKHFHPFPLATFTSLYSQSRVSGWIRVQMSWAPLYNGLRWQMLAAAQATKHKDILHAAAQLLSSQTLHGRKRRRGQGQRWANDSMNFSQNLKLPISMGSTEGKQSLVNVGTCWNMLEPLDQTRQVEVKVASLKPLTALSLGRWPELPSIFVANASCR